VQGVPEGDHAEPDQPEGHGPFHGATCPIAGLALWVPESRWTSRDLHVLVDEAAEPVSPSRPENRFGAWRSATRRGLLMQRAVRTMPVVMPPRRAEEAMIDSSTPGPGL
jgi:hypothetical protein